jgi:hypothetical protein
MRASPRGPIYSRELARLKRPSSEVIVSLDDWPGGHRDLTFTFQSVPPAPPRGPRRVALALRELPKVVEVALRVIEAESETPAAGGEVSGRAAGRSSPDAEG